MEMPSKNELLALDIDTRLELIEELWDSLANDPATAARLPITDEERTMLDQRLREHQQNPKAARPWAEVRASILAPR